MPSQTPPPGWYNPNPSTIEWGTDILRTASVTQSGQFAIHFPNTTPTVDPELKSNLIPIEDDVSVTYSALCRTSSIGVNDWVRIEIEAFQSDRITSTATSSRQVVLNAANTWQWVGETLDLAGASARYIQFTIKKNNIAYDAYFDRIQGEQAITGWNRVLTADQIIPSGTFTTVDFNAAGRAVSPGGGFAIPLTRVTESAGVITIGPGGQYNLSASVEFDPFNGAANVEIRFKITGTGGAVTQYSGGQYVGVLNNTKARVVAAAMNEWLAPGDTVEVEVWQNSGANATVIQGSAYNTTFRGVRVGVL